MEDISINISVKKSNIPIGSAEIVNFHFSNYKSMRNKKHTPFRSPLPVDAICVIWKESASRLQRRCRLKNLTDDGRKTDGRIPDACINVNLPCAPTAQVSKKYCHGLCPLLMQNPYSKFILAIATLSVVRFSKFLQVLLRQIKIHVLPSDSQTLFQNFQYERSDFKR